MQPETTFSSRILEILGSKSSRLTIVVSASLAVLCLFYAFTVGTQLQIRIYPLVDRITYFTNFDFYIVNEFVDHVVIGSLLILWLALSVRSKTNCIIISAFAALFIVAAMTNYDPALDDIALAAFPVIVSLIIYNWYSRRKVLDNTRSNLTLNYLAIIGIITGLISLAIAVSSNGASNNDEWPVARSYAYEMFLLFSSFSPVLILLLITSYPAKLLINSIPSVFKRITQIANLAYDNRDIVRPRLKTAYLSTFIFISMMMVVVPHLPTINNDNQQVGVDTDEYNNWLIELRSSKDIQEYFGKAFIEINNGDRPISVLLMSAFRQIITSGTENNPDLTIEYLPLLLGPLLVLTVYLLTRELTMNDKISLLAAFLTSISFHVLIGVYAGFYSNWISLIFGYLAFVFLFRFLKKKGALNLALYGILTTLTLFSHVYTWSILSIVMGIFLAICMTRWNVHMLSSQSESATSATIKRNAILLLVVLFCTVAVDIGRVALTGSSGGIERDLELGSNLAGIEQFALRWNNLTYGTTVYIGGLFANFLILGLGLYWLFTSRMKEKQDILMIVFLSIGILPFLFGDWVVQTRVFYNIPFQIPAALALFSIVKRTSNGFVKSIPIFIWLIAMSIITVSNFYLVLPSQ